MALTVPYFSSAFPGQESAIHQVAKELVIRSGRIGLPAKTLRWHENNLWLLRPAQVVKLDNAQDEVGIARFICDVYATVGGKPLNIEINVAHPVDQRKLQKLMRQGVSTVEIDLVHLRRCDVPLNELTYQVLSGRYAHWVFEPEIRRVGEAARQACRVLPPSRSWMGARITCPAKGAISPSACRACPYNLGADAQGGRLCAHGVRLDFSPVGKGVFQVLAPKS